MSQGMNVYLLDESDVRIFGSRDEELLKEVLEALADEFEELDEDFEVDEEDLITHADALREIFAGEISREEDCGPIYGSAFELYCASLGETLNNRCFCPCHAKWFDILDKHLKSFGVGVRFHRLLFEEFPIPVETDASPWGGIWKYDEAVAAKDPLQRLIQDVEDREILEALQDTHTWLEKTSQSPGSVIVGFFS